MYISQIQSRIKVTNKMTISSSANGSVNEHHRQGKWPYRTDMFSNFNSPDDKIEK